MSIERGYITVFRSSGAPCEAVSIVLLKLLNPLSIPIVNHKLKDEKPFILATKLGFDKG